VEEIEVIPLVDERFDELLHTLCADYRVHNNLNLEARTNSNIKRGLRNDDGTGVMVGCTAMSSAIRSRTASAYPCPAA